MTAAMITQNDDLDLLISRWHPDPSELSIDANGVRHSFGTGEARKQVLFDNDLQIRAGEIVIMTGPSGSGKTTLLTLIGTLRSLQSGSLKVHQQELANVDRAIVTELRKQIGFIFQAHNLFESLTAYQNVRMAAELVGMDSQSTQAEIERLLSRLGLGHRIHYRPKSLSGGQKQRVAIARGVVHSPRLILADEPTAALDAESGREVVTLFQELARQRQCTILIVTHDNRILDVADRIVNMVDGRIHSNVLVQRSALMCKLLQEFPLFQQLAPRVLAQVADKMDLKRYPPGTEIIRQGEIGDEFFVIGKGNVEILIDGALTNVLHAGQFFGEVSLMKKQPRNATVRAKDDVACFVLNEDEFQEIVKASASFEEELRRVLFERQ
jgi:putative ABC transport system ATP-binding protein